MGVIHGQKNSFLYRTAKTSKPISFGWSDCAGAGHYARPFFSQVFWGQIIYAIFLPLAFAVFVARFIDDKSIKDILMIMLRYHFCPQQFTQHVPVQKKKGTRKK